ncbi:MAG: dicarboxylate/amino acid:cation symporter [Clostridiales bacterium]|nr:dicarboxylate/amino acid:cation symporter [Clostridiales bacterium]
MGKLNSTLKILIAAVLAVLAGIAFGDRIQSVKIIGDIFLRLIQMNIILLVLGHIIEAVGGVNGKDLGKIGAKTITVFMASSLLASAWGVLAGSALKPGAGIYAGDKAVQSLEEGAPAGVSETILSFFPSNIIASMSEGIIIHVIVFGLLFGVALNMCNSRNEDRALLDAIRRFNEVIIQMVSIIMKMAPVGVFSIIACAIGRMGVSIIIPMIKYLGAYSIATLTFMLLWLAAVCLYCRVNFAKLCLSIGNMSIMALATTSSAITLPTAMSDSHQRLGVSERIAKFAMPLGMSLNSNGSAMHMAITIIAISQIYQVAYGPGQLVYIAVFAAMASLANAVAPGAGIVSLSIVIPAMGLPSESIALFAGVEWFVGMLRTILNVDSDAFSAMLVAKSENELDSGALYR